MRTPQFASSKRYPAFLRYIIEMELEEHRDLLKERTIGVEVFHRSPDYDTNSDTVVRFTASEVRKRLALIYHEGFTEHPVHLSLPVGSYVPEFLRPDEWNPRLAIVSAGAEGEAGTTSTRPVPWLIGWRLAILVIFGCVAAAATSWLIVRHRQVKQNDAMTKFWGPLEHSAAPVLVCPGAGTGVLQSQLASSSTYENRSDSSRYYSSVEMERALALITYSFGTRDIRYVVQLPEEVNLTQLQESPVLLLGAYSNKWTLKLANNLRYRFASVPAEIYDVTNPSIHFGTEGVAPDNGIDDFSLVTRYHDSVTDSSVVMIAGLGSSGTEAAAEFVTSPRYLDQLNRVLPAGWDSKNVEIVLKSTVIEGKSSAPSIKATYIW